MSANLSDTQAPDDSRIQRQIRRMGERARSAARTMAAAEPGDKNAALFAIAVSGYLLRPAQRARLNRLAGAVAVVAGAVTVLRGTPWMGYVMRLLHSA